MNSKKLSDLYKIRFAAEGLPRKNAIWRVLCKSFFNRFVGEGDLVVDLACGYGEFINNIRAAKKVAIDLNPDARKFLRPEVAFKRAKAGSFSSLLKGKADVIFTSNFLEHLKDKKELDRLLEQVFKALKPGGKFMILGPNLRYLPGQYWDFYDHHLGLTHLSLSEALGLKGFNIELCLDKFLPYTTKGALPTHPALVWLYLKLPLAWPLLGKQFFLLARKPA